MRRFSEILVGESFTTGSLVVNHEEIVEFARDFDPQPYHLDPDAADHSIFGGLCASGWHVTAVMMRQLSDCFGSAGIDLLGFTAVSSLRWLKPVFADDTLTSTVTVIGKSEAETGAETREETKDTDYGLLECTVEVANQDRKPVIRLVTTLMVGIGN